MTMFPLSDLRRLNAALGSSHLGDIASAELILVCRHIRHWSAGNHFLPLEYLADCGKQRRGNHIGIAAVGFTAIPQPGSFASSVFAGFNINAGISYHPRCRQINVMVAGGVQK